MSAERILIIEDDPGIQEMLKYAFAPEGWTLIQAVTGEEGLEQLRKEGADCIILDIMLPGMDGFKTLKKIKADERFRSLPVIMSTARGGEADVVAGLELGADDYVVKPYSPRVLAARIRAGLRRKEAAFSESGDSAGIKTSSEASASQSKNFFQHGKLKLDLERHTCFLDDKSLELHATEYAILAQFMSHPDIVFSRNKLINAIRGPDYPVTDRSVDVQILGLRKKLKEAGEMIETIRGVGYRFKTS
ncbi:MAG: response regulator transcription factor [Treponema sp.]|jgi:two-component system phosphate regulon response regulator PhoB|nr:response regulator transcription factor [Treponema sp.]